MTMSIDAVRSENDLNALRALFRDYAASLDTDLAFQGFEAECAALPGRYMAPEGALFLARYEGGRPLGCIAVRPLGRDRSCEMKRLFVRPAGRGTGLGRALAEAAIAFAEAAGYDEMVLDTLPEMTAAASLYRRLGFSEIPSYGNALVPGLTCFGRRLCPAPG